ncbi:recombination-associated protein RdgC [Vibrio europaeus]|uniref:recombination-associated protein RdgC n=1 Tax=Vibrio europaeus TaxID=300876 RepID=UPI00233E9448|nr:recombination-associated protein RdgC [Vibrio europaeus]MDC5718289.1 recombination-associated protein RdgC [Vibrio europaeus]
MQFKQCTPYYLPAFAYSLDTLEKRFEEFRATPLSDTGTESLGFVSPMDLSRDDLIIKLGCLYGFRLKIQEKKISPSKVKEVVSQRVSKIMEEKPDLDQAKLENEYYGQVKEEMLRLEIPSVNYVTAFIDTDSGYLFVNDKSEKRCEQLLKLLRRSLGSFVALPVNTEYQPSDALSRALQGERKLSDFLRVDYYDQIKAVGDKATKQVSFKGIKIGKEECEVLKGKSITQMGLVFCANEDETWAITIVSKRDKHFYILSFVEPIPNSDPLADRLFSMSDEDFNANWLITADRLNRIIYSLNESFGGRTVTNRESEESVAQLKEAQLMSVTEENISEDAKALLEGAE